MTEGNTVLELSAVAVEYGRRGQRVRAVDGVDLAVARGEIVGLVGESGCGKSTLARAAVGLEPLAAGTVTFEGHDVIPMGRRRRPASLRGLQMVFQDPYESLNPRRKVGELIADGVRLGGGSRKDGLQRAAELLDRVGLPATAVDSYPHEFSGGQRQRIAIARTLATQPSCLIADEPISALDASAQAQIANMLGKLVRHADLGVVLVSHDLSVVRQVADRELRRARHPRRAGQGRRVRQLPGRPGHPAVQSADGPPPSHDPVLGQPGTGCNRSAVGHSATRRGGAAVRGAHLCCAGALRSPALRSPASPGGAVTGRLRRILV